MEEHDGSVLDYDGPHEQMPPAEREESNTEFYRLIQCWSEWDEAISHPPFNLDTSMELKLNG